MISLLIADDEGFVRNGLIRNLDWQSLGVDHVEQAVDGAAAYEKASGLKPDILLTDIRMPRMDGIELATKLRETLPNCKVIFMSGYSDKEYLKSALHLKAVSYIEKPINLKEISKVISEAVSMCTQEKEKQALDLKKDLTLKESLDMLKVNFPMEIIQASPDNTLMEKWLNISNIQVTPDTRFAALIFNFGVRDWDSLSAKGVGKLTLQEQIHNLFLAGGITTFSSFKDANTMILIVIDQIKHLNENILSDLSGQIISALKDKCPVFIGMGNIVDTLQKIPVSYQSAVIASQQLFFIGYGKYSRAELNPTLTFELKESIINDFKELLVNRNNDKALVYLKELTRSIRLNTNTLIPNIKSLYFKILLVLLNHAARQKIVFSASSSESVLWETLSEFTTIDEVETFVLNFVMAYFSEITMLEGVSRSISDIYKIIEINYSNPELSIKFISDKLYISHSHLCVLFKKETGKTLNQHITEFRLEKARELLEDSTVKLYYVAAKVGYSDQNYFTKIFKKHTNMTPSEYREMRI
ncbi:MAG: two-component response regulator, CheY-like domain protein [Eubacterium sp.]|nr:two-component response regulator, CheY-like domain protein [Eubacterium sp.]